VSIAIRSAAPLVGALLTAAALAGCGEAASASPTVATAVTAEVAPTVAPTPAPTEPVYPCLLNWRARGLYDGLIVVTQETQAGCLGAALGTNGDATQIARMYDGYRQVCTFHSFGGGSVWADTAPYVWDSERAEALDYCTTEDTVRPSPTPAPPCWPDSTKPVAPGCKP
jgi:hypothetical protein